MKCTVLVDNMSCRLHLLAEWGYALHLATSEGDVLLDTGGHGHILLHNAAILGVDWSNVRAVALSHGHFDHVCGLADVLASAPQAQVWGAPSLPRERRAGTAAERVDGGGLFLALSVLNRVEPEATIVPGVTAFVVPEAARDPAFVYADTLWEVLPGQAPQHDSFADDLSLLVEGPQGMSLLLGCAHAGLPNILGYVRDHFGVNALHTVIGGTHLSAFSGPRLEACIEALGAFNVRHWRPNHCTGFAAAAALARRFDDVQWAGAGSVVEL
ncbi:MAG TPA: MBL fold metallo-hydrolase [Candidatus Avidesulfovibrio excrementigallinarum]|nr:MBL fold metallo-hydrolase [Candidatus Avidesulfovibrio excrementigallinarum]